MTKRNQTIIQIIVLIVLVLAADAYIYRDMQKTKQSSNNTTSVTATTTPTQNATTSSQGIVYSGNGAKVELVPTVPDNMPDLNRPITVQSSASLSADAQALMREQITTIEADLKKDPSVLNDWLQLGVDRKIIGDYQGAVLDWNFAGRLTPSDGVSFENLANLYGYYLKDNTKAEANYAQAIKVAPDQTFNYFNAVAFYRDVENNLVKARTIAQQGVSANPSSQELKDLLKSLQ